MLTDIKPGVVATVIMAVLLLAFAISVDFPKANGGGFKGDEATYYVLGHSLATDFDFRFERRDLRRVWEEFPGPEGIFLKRGKKIDIQVSSAFPFLHWVKLEDPNRTTQLYFSKSYIYPLIAAPFIMMFGTNGFLVFHALLLSLDFLVIYLFLRLRATANGVAVPLALTFLFASLIPVYFVWLTPELFNFSLALYALYLWAYGELTGESQEARADYGAAILLGILIFSKPTHGLLLLPIVALSLIRRQWRRAGATSLISAAVVAAFFAVNVGITGEFNYQGGDRKTFYSHTGFPFANTWETFDNIGPVRGRENIMVGDVLANTHSLTVLRHNLGYFLAGRYAGLVPYFFPAAIATALFVLRRNRQRWQLLVAATILATIAMHVLVWPFTWNGGGGPIGSRYFLSFYPLFLFLIPESAGLTSTLAALVGGALFTAQIVLNPFYSSINPGEHAKSGPLRLLPIELTLLNDLPVAQHVERMKQPLGGTPPVLAYFPDDNVFNTEAVPPVSTQCTNDCWFWVKGGTTADIVLRAPVASAGPDQWISKKISRLNVEIRNSGIANGVTVSTGIEIRTMYMNPGELQRIVLAVPEGVPYRRDVQPTSYVYVMSVATTHGFVPFLDDPCDKPCGPRDSRYLGAMIHVFPEYTDADRTTWRAPGGAPDPAGDTSGGLRDTP